MLSNNSAYKHSPLNGKFYTNDKDNFDSQVYKLKQNKNRYTVENIFPLAFDALMSLYAYTCIFSTRDQINVLVLLMRVNCNY